MSKYHIGKNGPGRCNATKRACPVGGEHFDSMETAEAAYSKEMSKSQSLGGVSKSKKIDLSSARGVTINNVDDSLGNQVVAGRTVDDYSKYISTLNEKFNGSELQSYTEEIRTATTLGENEFEEYILDIDSSGNIILEKTEDYYDDPYYSSEGYDEDYYNDNPFYSRSDELLEERDHNYDKLSSSKNYSHSEASVDYGNDSITFRHIFRTPKPLRDDIREFKDYNDSKGSFERLHNDKLPEWAVLPVNTVMDNGGDKFKVEREERIKEFGDRNNKNKKTGYSYFNQTPDYNGTELKRPVDPKDSTGYKNISRILSGEAEVERREKIIEQTEGRINRLSGLKDKYEKLLDSPKERNANPVRTMTYPTVTESLSEKQFKSLSRKDRSEYIKRTQQMIDREEALIKKHKDNINKVINIAPEEVKKLNDKLKKADDKYGEELKNYTIEKLSHHYPSVDRSVRIREATRWVNSHPELIGEEWDSTR